MLTIYEKYWQVWQSGMGLWGVGRRVNGTGFSGSCSTLQLAPLLFLTFQGDSAGQTYSINRSFVPPRKPQLWTPTEPRHLYETMHHDTKRTRHELLLLVSSYSRKTGDNCCSSLCTLSGVDGLLHVNNGERRWHWADGGTVGRVSQVVKAGERQKTQLVLKHDFKSSSGWMWWERWDSDQTCGSCKRARDVGRPLHLVGQDFVLRCHSVGLQAAGRLRRLTVGLGLGHHVPRRA